jgi:hypothetical protein
MELQHLNRNVGRAHCWLRHALRGLPRNRSAREYVSGLLLRLGPVGEGGPRAHAGLELQPAKEGSPAERLPGVHPHGLELGVA